MTTDFIQPLKDIVGERYVLTDSDSLQQYGSDRTTEWPAKPTAIVLPCTIDEVQAVVRLANQHQFAIVPSGGRTGLSGGAVAYCGEVVVAMDRLNKVLDVNKTNQTLCCEAGTVTAVAQQAAADAGLFYPVDFASSGSSQIGGNIATNAGGIKVIRYGMTRDWVAGLTVITGSGERLELNKALVKNNSGYDLRQLFIGSEGTLGLICEATLRLQQPPAPRQVSVLSVANMAAIVSLLDISKQQLSLTAFEFFSQAALQAVVSHGQATDPGLQAAPYYVLLEYDLEPTTETDLEQLFCQGQEYGWVVDGVVSQSEEQADSLWKLRENISDTLNKDKPYKSDVSVTTDKLPAFVAEIERLIDERYQGFSVIWYGHIGDGNLHLNILKADGMSDDAFADYCHETSEALSEIVSRFDGSVSAEHGVGLLKKPYLQSTRSAEEIALMKQIKAVFDPNGIMNPGKVFD